jgi:hypothetical protein
MDTVLHFEKWRRWRTGEEELSPLRGRGDEKVGGEKYNYVVTVLIGVETRPKERFESRWDHRRDNPLGLMQTDRFRVRFHVPLLEVHKG